MAGKYIKRKICNTGKWIAKRPYYIRRAWNRKRIKNRDFTIISNNCWAGRCYQYLDMPYLSPTIGLYFFAEDYLKFVSNLRYYLSLELKFINVNESKYIDILAKRNQMEVPVGVLGDIEVIFLHYKTEEEAHEKWNRRKNRVNYESLYIKFSKMNLCTEEHLYKFDRLNFKNKFMLNNRKDTKYPSEIYWSGPGNEREIITDTNDFPGNIRLTKVLNPIKERYPEEGLL